MAKLNEGDVIEGLFTIGLSLYLAYGKVDKTQLNLIRTKIDSRMFATGRFKYEVVGNLERQIGNNPPDSIDVGFEMRLKSESTRGVFGKDYQPLYESSKDIGNLDAKINQLVKHIERSSFASRASNIVKRYLTNDTSDNIKISVIADGIAGESSGGDVKGDVMLEIFAVVKNTKKKLISGDIAFSLKSGSVTVSNLAPYKGMLSLAKALNVKWGAEEKYIRLSKPFKGLEEQKIKFELISSMYNDLKSEIKKNSKQSNFTFSAMEFLKKNIFGSDLADVVDIQKGIVKEITVEYFNFLSKKVKLVVIEKGNNLVFSDKDTNEPIFQIRTKLRPPPANEAKFYLEVGKGIYSH